jgi:hypothetical protein
MDSLDGMTDEKFQSGFADKSVLKVHKIIGKRDGKPFSLQTVFLTFEVPTLTSTVFVVFERATFEPDILNPVH